MSDLSIARTAAAATRDDYDTVVVGAGQAGLAAAYYLRRAGMRFAVLDANEQIGASWQRRWDSLRLFTPARYNALPGMAFPGERYSLPGKEEVVSYFKAYVARFNLPVRLAVSAQSLHREAGRYVVATSRGRLTAGSVIVATGANQKPYVPALASTLAPEIVQLHSSEYRRAAQIPQGRVLVVGAGNSGAQIALELARAGREVLLSGRDTGSLPRRLLGRDIYDWLWPTLMRPTRDSRLGRFLMNGRLFSGDPLIGMPKSAFEVPRLSRVGRTTSIRIGRPVLDDGRVVESLAAVIWCTGFRPDFGWIEVPVFGLDGYPVHRRGVAVGVPGLAFLGLRFQTRKSSALLGGVGEDAEGVVAAVVAHLRAQPASDSAIGGKTATGEAPVRRASAAGSGAARRP